jgi:hypothetical protein
LTDSPPLFSGGGCFNRGSAIEGVDAFDEEPMTAAAEPYRTSLRPRLWVPGVLYVKAGATARLVTDRSAGYRFGWDDIQNWKSSVWLVEKTSLSDEAKAAAGIDLPEDRIDAGRLPHLHKAALAAHLAAVDEEELFRAMNHGARGCFVGYHRVSDGFAVTAWKGKGETTGFGADFNSITTDAIREARAVPKLCAEKRDEESERADDGEDERDGEDEGDDAESDEDVAERLRDELRATGLIDRILRSVTDGVVDEESIYLALALRQLIDPGYLMRQRYPRQAAPPRSPEEVARAGRGWDALLGEVFARARGQEEDAVAIAVAIADAPTDASVVSIPVYGVANRVRVPAVEVIVPAETEGNEIRRLLPAYDRWEVSAVEPWEPTLPADIAREMSELAEQERTAKGRRFAFMNAANAPRRLSALSLVALALLVALVAWLYFRSAGR